MKQGTILELARAWWMTLAASAERPLHLPESRTQRSRHSLYSAVGNPHSTPDTLRLNHACNRANGNCECTVYVKTCQNISSLCPSQQAMKRLSGLLRGCCHNVCTDLPTDPSYSRPLLPESEDPESDWSARQRSKALFWN